MRQELDHEVSLALLASAEAIIRMDFKTRRRVGGRPKKIRRRFKALSDASPRGVKLDAILAAWEAELSPSQAPFSVFREFLKVRHWLAHGRYWTLKVRRRADPSDVLESIRRLFAALPGFPAV